MKTTKKQHSNWLLIGALMFFLTAAGFTANQNEITNDFDCNVCTAVGCAEVAEDQIGKTSCDDDDGCTLSGFLCFVDPREPDPEEN